MTRIGEKLLCCWILSYLFGVAISGRILRGANGGARKQEGLLGQACITLEDKPGICVEMSNCKRMQELLSNKNFVRNERTESLLRNSKCGWKNNEPHICCSDSVQDSSSTRQLVSPITSPVLEKKFTTKTKPKDCGKAPETGEKIHGGRPADLGGWPWIVALGYSKWSIPEISFKCGASLISEEWILTAAHCIEGTSPFQLTTARLGDLDLDEKIKDNATPVDISIREVFVHPLYKENIRNYDVALLRLNETVKFSQLIQPVCLLSGAEYEKDDYYKKKEPVVVGWGVTENGSSVTRLLEAPVKIVELDQCLTKYRTLGPMEFTENILCAGQKGRDACQGDSGGPLNFINTRDSRYYLGGIVSAGKDCAKDFPGLYMRVARFIDWINRVTELDF